MRNFRDNPIQSVIRLGNKVPESLYFKQNISHVHVSTTCICGIHIHKQAGNDFLGKKKKGKRYTLLIFNSRKGKHTHQPLFSKME